jgi:hypothetical protein
MADFRRRANRFVTVEIFKPGVDLSAIGKDGSPLASRHAMDGKPLFFLPTPDRAKIAP